MTKVDCDSNRIAPIGILSPDLNIKSHHTSRGTEYGRKGNRKVVKILLAVGCWLLE